MQEIIGRTITHVHPQCVPRWNGCIIRVGNFKTLTVLLEYIDLFVTI